MLSPQNLNYLNKTLTHVPCGSHTQRLHLFIVACTQTTPHVFATGSGNACFKSLFLRLHKTEKYVLLRAAHSALRLPLSLHLYEDEFYILMDCKVRRLTVAIPISANFPNLSVSPKGHIETVLLSILRYWGSGAPHTTPFWGFVVALFYTCAVTTEAVIYSRSLSPRLCSCAVTTEAIVLCRCSQRHKRKIYVLLHLSVAYEASTKIS